MNPAALERIAAWFDQRDQELRLAAAAGTVAAEDGCPVLALLETRLARVDGDDLIEVGPAYRSHDDRFSAVGGNPAMSFVGSVSRGLRDHRRLPNMN